MRTSSERERLEKKARDLIRRRLGPLFTLSDHLSSLYERTANAIADNPRPGAPAKVGLILTTRIANDLRVCRLASEQGYGLQGLVLVGTIVELVGALSYVGHDENRAVTWAEHSDRRHSYPPRVVDGIDAILDAFGGPDPARRANWQEAYELMCMAKHGNPFLSLVYGLRVDSSGPQYATGPDASDLGRYTSAQTLWHSVGFGTAGAFVAAGHCSNSAIQAQLRDEAAALSQQLRGVEPWFVEVIKPQSPQSLEAEALHLQAEADRLNRETERLRLETCALRHKGGGSRRPR